MLIFDLAQKSISIPTAELPERDPGPSTCEARMGDQALRTANFDSQKEGSKHNSELGLNMITRYIKLLKQPKVPYLLSCLVEIRPARYPAQRPACPVQILPKDQGRRTPSAQ